MKILASKMNDQSQVKLHVEFYPYDRYETYGLKKANISAPTLLDALKKMVGNMGLYFEPQDIEDEGYTSEEIIRSIESTNGDGCDFIILLKNITTGEVYIEEDYYEDEDEW